MIKMYLRMLITLLIVMLAYTLLIYFVPVTGEKIDATLGVNWNQKLVFQVDKLMGRAKDAGDSFENKLDNPAPNTSKHIDARINLGQ